MLHLKKNKSSIYMKNNFFENDLQRRKERKYGKKIRESKECGQEGKQSWRLNFEDIEHLVL